MIASDSSPDGGATTIRTGGRGRPPRTDDAVVLSGRAAAGPGAQAVVHGCDESVGGARPRRRGGARVVVQRGLGGPHLLQRPTLGDEGLDAVADDGQPIGVLDDGPP